MSDLISRSELIKHFEAIQSQECAIGLDFVAMIDVIKEQPTAYDIDKVVEKLEENAGTVNFIGYGTIYEAINKDVAIEIVKQGGVDDDVCEWKRDDMCDTVYKVCGGCFTSEYQKDFKYCPYCGKKIRIVGD